MCTTVKKGLGFGKLPDYWDLGRVPESFLGLLLSLRVFDSVLRMQGLNFMGFCGLWKI